MSHNKYSQNQPAVRASASLPTVAAAVNPKETDFTPSPDEVARKAYFTYVNQGSRDGHEVQQWLAAEAELIAERKLTRVHGYHNRT